ncbi:MAG: hypothetical protein CVU05_14895 [Bacteroidetes bacterium HGW-Bacteroidetes-21]|nr:MAG: hypothetical protein CVU05_14895 [Bacteroidetes bacterium HGW-Bacteroidetes-21]
MKKKIISIVLLVVILVLAYLTYDSIMGPIRWRSEKEKRYKEVVERLKDGRKAQLAFYEKYEKYAESWDVLLNFIKTDSLPLIKAIGSVPDTLTEQQALDMKLIIRDTIPIAVSDTIFPKGYPVDSLKYIPFTNGAIFFIGAGEISTASGVKVKVFEIRDTAPFDPSNVMRVGSMTEATTSGNWE